MSYPVSLLGSFWNDLVPPDALAHTVIYKGGRQILSIREAHMIAGILYMGGSASDGVSKIVNRLKQGIDNARKIFAEAKQKRFASASKKLRKEEDKDKKVEKCQGCGQNLPEERPNGQGSKVVIKFIRHFGIYINFGGNQNTKTICRHCAQDKPIEPPAE